MTTMDYVIVMLGLVFIADIIGDVFKSYNMQDCRDEKMREIEGRVDKLEKLNNINT